MDEFSRAYLDECLRLAMSIVIKCDNTIEAMNRRIRLQYGEGNVDEDMPQSHRYNMHVCGMYHPTDTMMKITSLDTLFEIDFTTTNLNIHKRTKKAYTVGSLYLDDLIEKYPDNYSLILGIVNPADMSSVVSAKDGEIVSYDRSLVQEQELSLMKDLNVHCVGHHRRWNTRAHAYGHDFYPASYAAVFYSTLVPRIMNMRLARCKTYEAHTFHIKMYLASHYELDRYMRFMDNYQILFLYRNILYLERNCGKSEQFELLLEKLLTRRNIPISEINVRHLDDFDDEYRPELVVRKKALNPIYNSADVDYLTLETLQTIEDNAAPGNRLYWKDRYGATSIAFKNSSSSIVQTKDLYSSMYDYSDAVPNPLELVLLRQWIGWSFTNRYNANVVFRDPRTAQRYFLKARDAFLYMYMVGLKNIGLDVLSIDNIINCHELRSDLPDIYELAQLTTYANEDLLDKCEYSSLQFPIVGTIVSSETFYENAYKVYTEGVRQWIEVSNEHDIDRRAMLDNMFSRFYKDISYKVPPFNINDWIVSKSLPSISYSDKEAKEVMLEIFKNATGYFPDDDKQLGNIQRALIEVFRRLSSYTVQFISDINTSQVIPLAWSSIRINSQQGQMTAEGYQTDTRIEVQEYRSELISCVGSSDIPIDVVNSEAGLIQESELNIDVSLTQESAFSQNINIFIPSFTLDVIE